jgi:hypothetical protein
MGTMPEERNAFAAARHVLERLAELHPELGDLPVSRDDADWPAWLDRAHVAAAGSWSGGEKILLDIGTGLWTERHHFVAQLVGLDEENRARVCRAVVALAGVTGDLTGGAVVAGAFGPQFTIAERVLMAEAIAAFLRIAQELADAGMGIPRVQHADTLRELIARLQS